MTTGELMVELGVVGKNKFLVPFEDGQKKEIGSCLLVYLNEK